MQKWQDVDIANLASEVIGRNGRFHIMVSFMGMAVMPAVITDRTSRLIYMNKRAEDHWRVRMKNVIGLTWATVLQLSEKDAQRFDRESREVLTGNSPRVFFEWNNREVDTKLAECSSVLKFPFQDDDGDTLIGLFVLPHQQYFPPISK